MLATPSLSQCTYPSLFFAPTLDNALGRTLRFRLAGFCAGEFALMLYACRFIHIYIYIYIYIYVYARMD